MNAVFLFENPATKEPDIHHLKCKDKIIEIPLLLNVLHDQNYKDHGCIYRVPNMLRSVNETAYTPQMVSIGPFHHGKDSPMAMEHVKSRYLQDLCRRTDTNPAEFHRLVGEDCRKQLMAFYHGTFSPIDDFGKMVVTDTGFIIEFLYKIRNEESDIITCTPLLKKCIERDLMLLENQLPFFVLHEIFNARTLTEPETFYELTHAFFDTIPPPEDKSHSHEPEGLKIKHLTDLVRYRLTTKHKEEFNPDEPEGLNIKQFTDLEKHCLTTNHKGKSNSNEPECLKIRHFTDLVKHCLTTSHRATDLKKHTDSCDSLKGKKSEDTKKKVSLRNAKMLEEAGVNFMPLSEKTYLSGIRFRKGMRLRYFPCCNFLWFINWCKCCCSSRFKKCDQPTLHLPVFMVNHWTGCVLRNVMALEQCHYPDQTYVCDYVSLMDKLINTAEDVELLIDKNVIHNSLGSSKEVAQLLNNLCQHVEQQNLRYDETVKEITNHCKIPMNQLMATLNSVYFKDFWRGTTTIVGIIVLALTVWNTLLRRIL